MKKLIKILEDNGYGYYICEMVIWYGKGIRNKKMECDYTKEIGGAIDYKKGFQNIIDSINPNEELKTEMKERGEG